MIALFANTLYANATEDAFVEINDRVKKLFMKVNPTAPKVPDGYTAMNMVFSDNAPLLEFCDRSTETGSNIQKGYITKNKNVQGSSNAALHIFVK